MSSQRCEVLTVTLNAAIDLTGQVSGFRPGTLNRATNLLVHPGGKGINVAAALADFHHSVSATGFLGSGNALLFEELFEEKGIADQMIRLEGDTRTCIKISDPDSGKTTEINGPGLAVSAEAAGRLATLLQQSDAQCLALSGSLPAGLASTFYSELVARLRGSGRKVLLDTGGEPLRLALNQAPQIIKPNLDEFASLMGRHFQGNDEIVSAARSLFGTGLELVVVSMGPKGACFVTEDRALLATLEHPKPLSTVGAGDAMVAGILSAQLGQLDLEALARRSMAFANDSLDRIESGGICPQSVRELEQRVALTWL